MLSPLRLGIADVGMVTGRIQYEFWCIFRYDYWCQEVCLPGMYLNREIFPYSPLALVTAEVRLTDSPRLRRQDILDEVAIALEDRFPFSHPHANVMLNVGNIAPDFMPMLHVEQQRGVVLTNSTSTESVTITPGSFIYETTAYREFDDFRMGVITVCEALIGANVRPGLVRVGLRYIDEIRVPEPITDIRAWNTWIDGSVLRPLAVGPSDAAARTAQGLVTFDLGGGKGLNFQHAALNQGPVVEPNILKRKRFDPGPFFVLDLDGYRDFAPHDAVRLNADEVADILSAVHDPAGAAFQRAITDDARSLFRGGAA